MLCPRWWFVEGRRNEDSRRENVSVALSFYLYAITVLGANASGDSGTEGY